MCQSLSVNLHPIPDFKHRKYSTNQQDKLVALANTFLQKET